MTKNIFNRNFAVIIGINNYHNNIPPLETAVPDACKLAEILQNQHEALKPQYQTQNRYEVQLFLNQRANLNNLNQLIVDFKQGQIPFNNEKVTVTKDDRVLFYFAGHGIAKEALENQEGPVGYLIPQDATGNSNTYLPMQDLHDALNALPCRHMLAILDCCFAGAFRWSSLKRDIVPKVKVYKERYDRFISDAAWQVITSAADDQKAVDALGVRGTIQEGNEVHSPFAQALFNALRGTDQKADTHDGIMTATKLYSYLRDQVEVLTEKHFKRQTPTLCPLRKHDKGEFIFLLPNFDRDKLEDAPPLNKENNPYLGLQSYDEKDSHLFFGRENLIKELYQRVVYEQQGLTVILGASGTGKSSLMKAGLLKCLRDSEEQKFEILNPIRPGETPLKALTQAFFPILNTITAKELEEDEQALANIVKNWSLTNPKIKILLAVDQYEELITLCKSDEEREQFQNLIKNALAKYPNNIHVVITLRLDFEAQFQNSELKDFWNNDTRFVVPPMTQDELREAIEKPASEKVVYFEPPSLVNKLINEVVQMPGALPLLSFTLSELYLKYLEERRDNRALTETDYEELGRVVGSLTKRANQEYDQLVAKDTAYQNTIRRVMLRMIALQGGELARRQVPKWELKYPDKEENARVQTVIKHFSEARLIVEGANPQSEHYVEPAHDALVQGWDKLLEWKKEEEENLILQQRLAPASNDWKEIKVDEKSPNFVGKAWRKAESSVIEKIQSWRRDKRRKKREQSANSRSPRVKSIDYLWDDDPRLEQLARVLDSKDSWLNQIEDDFVRQSAIQRDRNTYRLSLIVTGVILGLTGLTIFASNRQREAEIRQILAFVGSSQTRLASNQTLDARIDSLRAGQTFKQSFWQKIWPDVGLRNQVLTKLSQTIYGGQELNRIEGNRGGILEVAFSPNGKLIATGGWDGSVSLWDTSGKLLPLPGNHQNSVSGVAFSPDNKLIASSGGDNTVRIWDTSSRHLVALHQHQGPVHSIAFSPNSKLLATREYADSPHLWDTSGKLLAVLNGHQNSVTSVVFSPDGKRLATSGSDATVRLWNTSGKQLVVFNGQHQGSVWSVTFSPDGQLLATSGEDGNVRLWDTTGKLVKVLPKVTLGLVTSIMFSPDGNEIGIGGRDGTVSLWNIASKRLVVLQGRHQGAVTSIAFNPDSKLLVTVGEDRNARLWDITNKQSAKLQGDQGWVNSAAFSLDSKLLATIENDGIARLWNTHSGRQLALLQGHKKDVVTSVAFSPDGKLLSTTAQDGTARLWDTTSGKQLSVIQGDEGNINNVVFSPDGKFLATNGGYGYRNIQLWNTSGNQLATFQGHQGFIRKVVFSPNGKLLATSADDETARLWDIFSGKSLAVLQAQGGLRDVVFSPDSKLLATAGGYHTAQLWYASGQQLAILKGHEGLVRGLMFSPDGKLLATGAADGTVRLWESSSGRSLAIFKGHQNGWVNSVAFSPDGKLVASSADYDDHLRLWDTYGNELAVFQGKGNFESVAFSPNGQQLLTVGDEQDGRIAQLWRVGGLNELLSMNCNWVRDYLKNNSNVSQSDRHLCDDVPTLANPDQ